MSAGHTSTRTTEIYRHRALLVKLSDLEKEALARVAGRWTAERGRMVSMADVLRELLADEVESTEASAR
jgi:hypothetical protein